MSAAELLALGEKLSWQAQDARVASDGRTFSQAAEILELIAWAEDNKVDVQRGQYFWWSRNVEDGQGGDKALIGLLRRAREANNG